MRASKGIGTGCARWEDERNDRTLFARVLITIIECIYLAILMHDPRIPIMGCSGLRYSNYYSPYKLWH